MNKPLPLHVSPRALIKGMSESHDASRPGVAHEALVASFTEMIEMKELDGINLANIPDFVLIMGPGTCPASHRWKPA